MNIIKMKQPFFSIICLLLLNSFNFSQEKIPSPKLVFVGSENIENAQFRGKSYIFSVENRTEFPNEMFETASDLPPCGKNANSSRSWIDFYGTGNKRLYGFCAIKSNSELVKLSFSLSKDTKQPEFVYIVITDRKTKNKYSSNVIELKKE